MTTRRKSLRRALLLMALVAGLTGCRITTAFDGLVGDTMVPAADVERLPGGGFVVSGCLFDSSYYGAAVLVVAPNGAETILEPCRGSSSIATDGAGRIYVSFFDDLEPDPATIVSMTASGGARATRFTAPPDWEISQVGVSPDGTDLYVGARPTFSDPFRIYRVTGPTSAVEVAGTQGLGSGDFIVDDAGVILVPDPAAHVVRRIAPDGSRTVVAGTGTAGFSGDGGPATAAQLTSPSGVDLAPNGDLLIADRGTRRVRSVRAGDGHIFTVAGGGTRPVDDPAFEGSPAAAALLQSPGRVAADGAGGFWVVDHDWAGRVYHVGTAG